MNLDALKNDIERASLNIEETNKCLMEQFKLCFCFALSKQFSFFDWFIPNNDYGKTCDFICSVSCVNNCVDKTKE
ncbi:MULTISPECIES: hypothetical protein [unclassified Treponema]|uniref:hypothetical protein n=1 Tax=unclassified Treponema TaxID=2638727 RepID=UPI0020A4FF04|nr:MULTISPECIES: hypothetical protein [unclassified Treponema]UTC68333.1 hypothetical protein E4O06_06815 [Treponema sp. OMZ 789]UTC71054.1 hypothetical protein E4O01_06960 [Treponema sp. OMZ 790]UTC73795.1 hypothetical protein E4O02_07155 [Treponema sp. OMZ 791]